MVDNSEFLSLKKIRTDKYYKDTLFDQIDAKHHLNHNSFIKKANKADFLFNGDLNKGINYINWNLKHETSLQSKIGLSKAEQFLIKIEELEFENKYHYKFNLMEKYSDLNIIGEGAFGIVLSAYDKELRLKVAIKIMKKRKCSKRTLELFDMEVDILLNIKHNNVVEIYGVEENDNYKIIVFELMEWISLRQLIVSRFEDTTIEYLFTIEEASAIMKGLLEGVDYLHLNGITHRDLKPDNIMFKKIGDFSSLKIIDLGLAVYTSEMKKEFCGTVIYMAPEVVRELPYKEKVDMWSVGICLFIICSGGRHPLPNLSRESYIEHFKANIKTLNWNFDKEFCMYFNLLKYN